MHRGAGALSKPFCALEEALLHLLVVWACSSHRSTHVWNLIDKLSATNEQHLYRFDMAGLSLVSQTLVIFTGSAAFNATLERQLIYDLDAVSFMCSPYRGTQRPNRPKYVRSALNGFLYVLEAFHFG